MFMSLLDIDKNYLFHGFCDEVANDEDITKLIDYLKKIITLPDLSGKTLEEKQTLLCKLLKANTYKISEDCKHGYIRINDECLSVTTVYNKIIKDEVYRNLFSPIQILKIINYKDVFDNKDKECYYYKQTCDTRMVTIDTEKLPECQKVITSGILSYFTGDNQTTECKVNKATLHKLYTRCGEIHTKDVPVIKKMLKDIFTEMMHNEFKTKMETDAHSMAHVFEYHADTIRIIKEYHSKIDLMKYDELCSQLLLTKPENKFLKYTNKLLSMASEPIFNTDVVKGILSKFGLKLSVEVCEYIALFMNILVCALEYNVSWSYYFILLPGGRRLMKQMLQNPEELAGFLIMIELSMTDSDQNKTEGLIQKVLKLFQRMGINIPTTTEILKKINMYDIIKGFASNYDFQHTDLAIKIVSANSHKILVPIFKTVKNNIGLPDKMKQILIKLQKTIDKL